MKQRNLFVFFMESISSSLFWQFRESLPTLWQMLNKSMQFTRCYSAGSATLFTVHGLMRGSICGLDCYARYKRDWRYRLGRNPTLFEILEKEYGYDTFCAWARESTLGDNGFIGPDLFQWSTQVPAKYGVHFDRHEPEILRRNLEKITKPGNPVAGIFYNAADITHNLWRPPLEQDEIHSAVAMQLEIMRSGDSLIAHTLHMLEERDLLSDALLVFFGDHGFGYRGEPVSAQFHQGVVSSCDAAWVPFFMCNSSFGIGVNDALVSTDDFAPTLLGQLIPDTGWRESEYPYSGVDIAKETRKFACTQNKFALQDPYVRDRETPKSYSVTDGQLRLTATVPDVKRRTGGMQAYLDQWDSGNRYDLLGMFFFDAKGDVIGLDKNVLSYIAMRGRHLYGWLHPGILADIVKRYAMLRDQLREYVRTKEAFASEFPEAVMDNIMPEESFLRVESMMKKGPMSLASDSIRTLLSLGRAVYFYGAGKMGRRILAMTREIYKFTPAGFIDRGYQNFPHGVDGVEVIPLEEVTRRDPFALIIGCTGGRLATKQMREECRREGLDFYSLVEDLLDAEFNFILP